MPILRLLDCGIDFHAPCRKDWVGCPKGTPENSKALNARNQQCYEHYLECVVTGNWPDDELVIQNAVIIREAEKEIAKAEQLDFQRQMLLIAGAKQ